MAVCNLSAMNKETNSSPDTFTEQTIFDFLLSIFCSHSTTIFVVLWNIQYFPKRLSYQFLAFKDLYFETKLRNKFSKKLCKTIWPSAEFWPPHINIIILHINVRILKQSCPDCLRILIMSWLFKEIISSNHKINNVLAV